ncbi:hypothetical protein ADK54_33580 [Streptomyces sp. WM6378]|nr:hypothetical protein ADK54_33580 [Streptomyces sp. WM6378]
MRVLLAGALVVVALALSAVPASTDSYLDQRSNTCRPEGGIACAYGLVVTYWHRPGSLQRAVSWVYVTRSPANTHNMARWWYRAPGGQARVGGARRRGTRVQSWTEITWGSGGHRRTGPVLSAGTQICAEFNYSATTRPCVTLK